MRFTISFSIFALFAASTCNLLQAKDSGEPFKWLTQPQELALANSAPAAPTVNSAVDQDDYKKVLAAQSARTPETIAESQRDEKFSYTLFETIYGAKFSSVKSFQQLVSSTQDATEYVNGIVKSKYKRDRPFREHPDVKALFQEKGFSYPSSHSSKSFALAVVLGAIFPDKKQAFLDRAEEIAQSRGQCRGT